MPLVSCGCGVIYDDATQSPKCPDHKPLKGHAQKDDEKEEEKKEEKKETDHGHPKGHGHH